MDNQSALALIDDESLLPSNQIKTHKNFADCRYDVTISDIKIILGLVSLVKKYNNEFRSFTFSISGLAHFLGLKHQNKNIEVRKTIEGLKNKQIILPYEGLSKSERPSLPWLVRTQISESRDFVELKLNPELAELLTDPEIDKNYIAAQMATFLKMKSTYAVKLYFLLKKFYWAYNDGSIKKNTFEKSIIELKQLLQIPLEKYPLPGNFKAIVLNAAKKECDKHADISFTLEPLKRNGQGQSIYGYKFTVIKNPNYKPEVINFEPISSRATGMEKYDKIINEALIGDYSEAVKKLIKHEVTKSGIAEIINICSADQIVATVIKLEKSNIKIGNMAGAIRTACREEEKINNAPLSEYDRLRKELLKEDKYNDSLKEIEEAKAQIAAGNEKEKNALLEQKAEEYLSQLSTTQFKELIQEFLDNATEMLKYKFEINESLIQGSGSNFRLLNYIKTKINNNL